MQRLLLACLRWRRIALIVAVVVLGANASVAIGACSSSTTFTDDHSNDSGPTGGDSGKDGLAPPPPPPGLIDSGKMGNCSAVKGACDIVAQNCPKGQECVVVNGPSTQCVPVSSSEQLAMGTACCPSTTSNPCLPGLVCVGNACVDGGPQTGRCTPACCMGDDKSCGKSQPEGISGACDSILTYNGQETNYVCSYQERCVPFGVEPCKTGDICLIHDKLGSSGCFPSNYDGGAGAANRASCKFANDCADGYICLDVGGGATGQCRMECLTPGAVTPFDAGGVDGGPLTGGCPASELCNGHFDQDAAPAWLSVCGYSDGG